MTTKNLTLKSMLLFVGLMGLTMMIFSCARNGLGDNQNNNNNNNNNVFQNCNSCQGLVGGQRFFKSQSVDVNSALTLELDFIGANYNQGYNQGYNQPYNQSYPYSNYNNGSSIVSYAGPVGAEGTLVIARQMGSYGCVIPAGTYYLQTVQAGQWSQTIVSGLVLQASSGPMSLVVHIPRAQVAAKTPAQAGQTWNEVAPIGRLFGHIEVRALSGVSCQVNSLLQ